MRSLAPWSQSARGVALCALFGCALIPSAPALAQVQEGSGEAPFEEDGEALLEEEDEALLETITVETRALADRGAMSGSAQRVEQIDPELLERRGVTNLADALQWLSAGSPTSPTNTTEGLIIDGLPSSQVVVLRDGLPLTRPAGSQQGPIIDLASIAINPDTIERIDVYRGAGPVGSGSAAGVIIDVITKRNEPGWSASLRAQSASQLSSPSLFGQDLLLAASWGGSREVSLSGTAIYSRSEAFDVDGDGRPDLAERERGGGEIAWTWRPSMNDFLRFVVLTNVSTTTSVGGEQDVFDDLVDRDIFRLRAQGRWWLNADTRFDHNLDLGLENNRFRKRVRSSDFLRLKSDTTQESAQQIVALTRFTKRHDLSAEAYGRGWRIARVGETGVLPQVRQGEIGAGLSDTFYAGERAELFARVIAEQASAYGGGVNAQASAAYTVAPSIWVVRATASSTRRVPTPEELYLDFDHAEVGYRITGNPGLQPERLHSGQLSSVWNTKDKRFGLEAQAFLHQIEDVVIIQTIDSEAGSSALFTYGNGGRARVIGAQLQMQLAELFWDLDLLGNYTAMPVADDLDQGARLPQRPRHAGRVELRRRFLPQDKLEVWSDLSSRTGFDVPPGSPQASANAIVGLGARYRFDERWALMCDVNNLLDQSDVTWGPLPGRFAFLSLMWRASGGES